MGAPPSLLRGWVPELVLLRGAGGPGCSRAGWWLGAGRVDLVQARETVLEQCSLRATLVADVASPTLSMLLRPCPPLLPGLPTLHPTGTQWR